MNMKKKVLSWLLVLAIVATFAVGCTSGNNNSTTTPQNPTTTPSDNSTTPPADAQVLRICHVAPSSGSGASFGKFIHNSAALAVKEINDAGGFKGPNGENITIEYHQVDETTNSAQTVEAVQKAISLKPLVIMGPNRSGGVMASEKLWADAKIPTITDPTGTGTNHTEYTFRMQIPSPYWVPLLVKTAVERYDCKKPAVISALNDYCEAMAVEAEPAFKELGIDIVTHEVFNDGDTDFSAQLLSIKDKGCDGVFVFAYAPEMTLIFRQVHELG